MSTESIDARIGARVRALRTEKKTPVDVVAKAAGLTPYDYLAREAGDISFTAAQLWTIAAAMGVPFEELFRDLISTSEDLAGRRH